MKATNKTINKVVLLAFCIVLLFLFINMLLTPAHVFTKEVKQMAQLMSIDTALELYNSEFDEYPPSGALDPTGRAYCGAMKLAEALVGKDLKGIHKDSVFRSDGMDSDGTLQLYSETTDPNFRKSIYLPFANAFQLCDIYENTEPFDANSLVLCDRFRGVEERTSGYMIGMPILYYKADTSKTAHDVSNPDNPENIYNYKDNYDLLALGVPGQPGKQHPLYEDPALFYKMTRNEKVTTQSIPYKDKSFILLSAGNDGLYGTKDDICNFDMSWRFDD